MPLNHSKTWPISTLAVVQLRVDSKGRTYSTLTSEGIDEQKNIFQYSNDKTRISDKYGDGISFIYPLSKQHLEAFTEMSTPARRTTVRTDTVSTILDQDTEFEYEQQNGQQEQEDRNVVEAEKEEKPDVPDIEKFHVLALTRIEESLNENTDCPNNNSHHEIGRRPSIRVDNWDFIYTETFAATANQLRCPVHRCVNEQNSQNSQNNKEPDLPLDARKTTTLRRHYYPEGGWGWVIIVCSVLVHILNHGVQLSCSQLVLPGSEKFKVETVHFSESQQEYFRMRRLTKYLSDNYVDKSKEILDRILKQSIMVNKNKAQKFIALIGSKNIIPRIQSNV